jgi:hypothetical protein
MCATTVVCPKFGGPEAHSDGMSGNARALARAGHCFQAKGFVVRWRRLLYLGAQH